MSISHVLALDIGTSSVRAALYDAHANAIPETFVKHERRLSETDDGGAEIDAFEAFDQVVKAIDEVHAKCGDREVAIAASSSFWHSLMGIDENGDPTTKVFAWGEKRPARFVAQLRRELDEAAVHQRTGARFHASFWPAKLLWLRADSGRDFERTARWISFSDFVALKLSSRILTSISMSSATGLFDQRRCVWDEEICTTIGVEIKSLPPIAATDDGAFELNSDFSKRWPKFAATKWLPAIGDGAANTLGAGCDKPDCAALMIGTSGAMRVAYKGDVPDRIPEGLWCYRIDRERVIIGGALSDGGGLFRWLKDNLKLAGTDDEIEAEIARRGPDAHGLTFLPFFFGERSTGYHEDASGAVLGLRSTTDAIDVVQAGLESVAYRFAEIFEQLCTVTDIKTIIASGGALRESPVWTQIIADVLGRDLFLPDTREASSRGAVIHALNELGANREFSKVFGSKFLGTPHVEYAEARFRHQKHYDLILNQLAGGEGFG